MDNECTNPTKPCHLHDPTNEWHVEIAGTTAHSGWLLAFVGVLIIISTYWGLN